MERTLEELEELLPESSTQLVSLNTRVPRNVSKMIDESVGILQTESPYLKVSKQVAVQILIERGFQAIKADFEREDQDQEILVENVVSIEREPKPQRAFDVKSYAEFSNKSSYEPRLNNDRNSHTESKARLQNSLGLR
jgi:hypothetical protein